MDKNNTPLCPLCGHNQFDLFHQMESFGFPIRYYQCQSCGLVQQNPLESQAADPAFYAETYRKVYQASAEPTPKDLAIQKKRADHLLAFLRQAGRRQVKTMLDVGCSAGVWLNHAKTAYNCQINGVEPGEAYRQFAQKNGVKVFASIDEMFAAQTGGYDLISLLHVLEHLVDPLAVLKKLRQVCLHDDGALLLEVPNFYAHDSYELAHLHCYTPHTLRQMVQQAGYQVIALKAHGVPRSKLLKLYITLLAVPLPEGAALPALTAENGVARKRSNAMLYRRIVQKLLPAKAWLPLPGAGEK